MSVNTDAGLQTGLTEIRVIDFSNRIAGSYATKMLADAGAEVTMVEPVAGHPLRCYSATAEDLSCKTENGEDGAFFKYLHTGKMSVTGAPSDPHIIELIGSADLVIESFAAGSEPLRQFQELGLARRFPQLVSLSISPYGRTGPYANRAATDFTIQADSGSLLGRGLPTQSPIMAGGKITEYIGGTFAVVAALAAVMKAQATGAGEEIDFSLLEVFNIAGTVYADLSAGLWGYPEVTGITRMVEVPSIEPSKDGWVGFATLTYQQFSDFLTMIGRPELREQKDLANILGRSKRMDEWNAAVHAWTKQKTTEEIIALAAAYRVPVAPLNNGKTVFDNEHFVQRGVFVENPGSDFFQPRPPYFIDGRTPYTLKPSPRRGEHQHTVPARKPRIRTNPRGLCAADLPLKGIRVLDATAWWSGPAATQMLAHLGAEVIHLEAIQRPDGSRMMGGMHTRREQWWEYSAMNLSVNTNKKGLTLNLGDPDGLALMRQLIGECDVFVENYSPRVMEGFGFSREQVRALNPDLIYVRMPAFGLSGPWKDYVGFAQTMEQMTGMAWMTGHVEDQPRIQRGPCDTMAGMNAAFAALVALEERNTTGKGSFIECSMVEGALNAAAEQAVEYSAYGRLMVRGGNRTDDAAPQGLYPCKGHCEEKEQWLALSIASDSQWQSLKNALANPAWADNSRFDTLAGRRRYHDAIDKELALYLNDKDLDATVISWAGKGIPVALVHNGTRSSQHPQLHHRGFFETLEHPVVGWQKFTGAPFRFRSVARWLTKTAPTIGEDNDQLLSGLLGLQDDEIAELVDKEVVGVMPQGL